MATATKLERSFADVCRIYGLSAVSVSFHMIAGCSPFTVFTHAGERCSSGSGDSVAQALGASIAELHATPIPLADEPLIAKAQEPLS